MKFSYMLPRNTKAKAMNMVLNSNDRYDRHYRAKVAKKLRDLAKYQESGRVFDPYTVDRPCRVIAHIYPPTKQDMDPPNVWPTVKPLMDGLTDAGVWNDDNGRVVAETSFRLGGVSGKKGHYLIELEIQEELLVKIKEEYK